MRARCASIPRIAGLEVANSSALLKTVRDLGHMVVG